MKKVISITFSLLMILGMVHFSVATHFCTEREVTSRVSLSGKLATCGMEDTTESLPVSGINLTSHCCDDVVNYYGINSNYTPSFLKVPEFYQYNIKGYILPEGFPVASADFVKTSCTRVNPNGVLMSTNVDLSNICVFRI